MATPIPLADCLSLIHLLLTADELGPIFNLKGVQCSIKNIDGNACFDARAADFDLMLIVPGWHAGAYGRPAYIIIVGETHKCLQWLPIARADKYALVARLPLSATDQALCRLVI